MLRRPKFCATVTAAALSLTAFAVVAGTTAAAPAHAAACDTSLPFRNPHLALQTRINDLIGRLTTAQKIEFLHQYQPAIGAPLCIPVFKTGTEALHGVAWSNDLNDNGNVVDSDGTSFPQAVGLASTWNPALISEVGNAVGQDARGYNAENPTVWGLNLWGPVVNLLRNPLWGRNEEGYSEDPYLTSAIATAYGQGIEGNNPRYLQAAPTLKHYLAYNNEADRATSSSEVPPRVLQEYDRAAFRGPLEAGAATGQWIEFAGADLRGHPGTFTAQVAKGSAGTAQIQVRLGNPRTGPLIGTATVTSTGGVYDYTITSTGLTGASGIRDVYLVFTGDLRIASFSMK